MADRTERVPLHRHFQAPGIARAHVRNFCAEMPDHVAATAQLLTSELVTCAIEREPPVEVVMSVRGDRLRVEVSDGGPPVPPSDAESSHRHGLAGHALAFLDALALSWGSELDEDHGGRCVWFALHVSSQPVVLF